MIPGLQIIFEQPKPRFDEYVFEDVERAVAAYYRPPLPRMKDVYAFAREFHAIAEYHATDFHPRCIQAIGDVARRLGFGAMAQGRM